MIARFVLWVWIAATPPAQPTMLPFGPFTTQGLCEETYKQVSGYYMGTVQLQHVCQPQQG